MHSYAGHIVISTKAKRWIRIGAAIMHKTARATTDKTKVPWCIDGSPQHKPFYQKINGGYYEKE